MRRLSGPVAVAWLVTLLGIVAVNCSSDFAEMKNQSLMDDFLVSMLTTFGNGWYQMGHSQFQVPSLEDKVSLSISATCMADLSQLNTNYKALDAFGKPGAGLYEGNNVWLGNYDECLSIDDFNYCLSGLQLDASKIGVKGVPLYIRWGICVPTSCSNQELLGAMQYYLALLELKYVELKAVTALSVTCIEFPPIPYSAGVICTIVLLSILAALMISGSLYDEWLQFDAKKLKRRGRWLYCAVINSAGLDLTDTDQENEGVDDDDDDDDDDDVAPLYDQENSQRLHLSIQYGTPQVGLPGRILLCFAFTRNLSKLLDTQQKDTSISSLNGIRVISMTWVILGHSLFLGLITGSTQNPVVLLEWLQNFGFQAVANAYFSVDSFFFLSGVLVSFLTLSRMPEMRSAKAWAWFYFHRYWRLTPTLGLTILVWMYIEPYFGDGPLWYTTTGKAPCEKYWWTDLLYINNFYPQGFGSQCIGWVWYLANDMQFFVISPLLLVPLFYAPVIGWIALVSLTVACMITTAVIMVHYNASVDILGVAASAKNGYGLDDTSLIYAKPYCRIFPYLVGIGLSYIMYRVGSRRVKMSPLFAVIGWLVAAGIAISVVYGFYPSYHTSESVPVSRAVEVTYGTLSRFAWGVSLAWVVFACKYGYGGWVNGFLSWSFWIPLGRLTYSAYLFHPIVFTIFYHNFGTPIYESKYLLAYYFVGNLLLSYVVALFVSLAVEYPLAALEKLFMPNNPKEKVERYQSNMQDLHL